MNPNDEEGLVGLVRDLLRAIRSLQNEMGAHRAQLLRTDRRSRWARTAVFIVGVVGVVGVTAGVGGVGYAHNAQATANDIIAVRTDNRVSSCRQANVLQHDQREAEATQALVLANNLAPAPRDAATTARVNMFLAQTKAASVAGHPYRDCSSAGISAYLSHPPADPAG